MNDLPDGTRKGGSRTGDDREASGINTCWRRGTPLRRSG